MKTNTTNTTTQHPALRSKGWTDAEVNAWIGDWLYPVIVMALVAFIVRALVR